MLKWKCRIDETGIMIKHMTGLVFYSMAAAIAYDESWERQLSWARKNLNS